MNRCVVVLLAASLLSGCATWDWEAASAYAASPQYQAYQAQLRQQSYLDQQLANQRNYYQAQALINQSTANAYAWQNQLAQTQAANWQARQAQQNYQNYQNLNRRLDAIQYSINRPVYRPPHW